MTLLAAVLSAATATAQALPQSITDWLGKVADSGPGLTKAQKERRQAEFAAITTPPRDLLANAPGRPATPVLCGRGEMRQSANRLRLQTSDGKYAHLRLAFVYAPEEPQTGGRGALVNAMQFADLRDLCALLIASAGAEPNGEPRYIATVYTAAGLDVGLELIKMGLAWHWEEKAKGYQHPISYKSYSMAQKWVRDWREGLFAAASPVPPWEFSKGTSVR